MKKNSILGLIGILLAGAALGGVVLMTLNNGTAKAVVAVGEIEAGDIFSSEDLKVIDMPKKAIVEGLTISDMNKIIGKVATSDIANDEMITETRVANSESEGYLANMNDSKKNFGIQIAIPESTPIQGLSVGDYVSVFTSIEGNDVSGTVQTKGTGRIGDKFKVIGINKNDSGVITNITIEVTPDFSSKVTHCITNNSVIVTFVSGEHIENPTKGITQSGLFEEIIK